MAEAVKKKPVKKARSKKKPKSVEPHATESHLCKEIDSRSSSVESGSTKSGSLILTSEGVKDIEPSYYKETDESECTAIEHDTNSSLLTSDKAEYQSCIKELDNIAQLPISSDQTVEYCCDQSESLGHTEEVPSIKAAEQGSLSKEKEYSNDAAGIVIMAEGILCDETTTTKNADEDIRLVLNRSTENTSTAEEVAQSTHYADKADHSTHSADAVSKKQHERNVSERSTLKQETVKDQDVSVKPLTLDQLRSIYSNPQLLQNQFFIDSFIQSEEKKDKHEFYEIVHSYYNSRLKFIQVEREIRMLQEKYQQSLSELWITSEKQVTAAGICGDERKVSCTHTYEMVEINQLMLDTISKILQEIRTTLEEKFSMFAYSAQLSRLQVESYIHNLFMQSPVLKEIPRNAPVQAIGRNYRSVDVKRQVATLRDCISVLFMFHRRPTNDKHFVQDIRGWTDRLVAALQRVASFEDHLFILNHVLRCPAGISKWASSYIQLPQLPCELSRSTFGNPMFDHYITTLATICLPVSARDTFMSQMNKALMNTVDSEAWILVDSEGEEDEVPEDSWLLLHENDLMSLVQQIRVSDIFRHIFLMVPDADEG